MSTTPHGSVGNNHTRSESTTATSALAAHPQIPTGWVNVEADATRYEASFVNIAVDVMRTPGSEANALPTILRGWFGPDAGRPGTNFHVLLGPSADGFLMRPANERPTASVDAEL